MAVCPLAQDAARCSAAPANTGTVGALLSSENWVEGTAQGNETKARESPYLKAPDAA
jgi:hypothetical protein